MKPQYKFLALLSLLLLQVPMVAQDFASKMEDSMYDTGLINVVIGVILIIFAFFIIYLVRLDRKVSRLEQDMKDM